MAFISLLSNTSFPFCIIQMSQELQLENNVSLRKVLGVSPSGTFVERTIDSTCHSPRGCGEQPGGKEQPLPLRACHLGQGACREPPRRTRASQSKVRGQETRTELAGPEDAIEDLAKRYAEGLLCGNAWQDRNAPRSTVSQQYSGRTALSGTGFCSQKCSLECHLGSARGAGWMLVMILDIQVPASP